MSSCYNCTGLLETGQKPGYFQLPLFRVVGQFLLIRQAAPSRSELPGSPLTATPVSNASFHGNADVATLRGARNPLSERHAYGLYSSTGPKYWYVQSWALALPVHFHTQRILRWATPFGVSPRRQPLNLPDGRRTCNCPGVAFRRLPRRLLLRLDRWGSRCRAGPWHSAT